MISWSNTLLLLKQRMSNLYLYNYESTTRSSYLINALYRIYSLFILFELNLITYEFKTIETP